MNTKVNTVCRKRRRKNAEKESGEPCIKISSNDTNNTTDQLQHDCYKSMDGIHICGKNGSVSHNRIHNEGCTCRATTGVLWFGLRKVGGATLMVGLHFSRKLSIKTFTDIEEGQQGSHCRTHNTADIFRYIWEEAAEVTLPSRSWSVHYLTRDANKAVLFSEMIPLENGENITMRKKLFLKDSGFTCFLFEKQIESKSISIKDTLASMSDLQNFLTNFHNMRFCEGASKLSEIPEGFSSRVFIKGPCGKVLRHINCSYVIVSTSSRKRKCSNCLNIHMATSKYRTATKNLGQNK